MITELGKRCQEMTPLGVFPHLKQESSYGHDDDDDDHTHTHTHTHTHC